MSPRRSGDGGVGGPGRPVRAGIGIARLLRRQRWRFPRLRHRQGGPVERYLRRLNRWLPRQCRREMVAEARRHLYDATARAERNGLTGWAAQRAAVRAFGPAW